MKPLFRLAPVFPVALLCLAIRASAASISWDGGGGDNSWHNARNWSGDALPGPTDDVMVNPSSGVIVTHSTGTTTVRSLQCQKDFSLSGGTLTVTAGASFVRGALALRGGILTVRGVGTAFDATGATSLDGTSLSVTGGATLSLPNLEVVARSGGGHVSFTADGVGTVLDLPGLTRAKVQPLYRFELEASASARINVPNLAVFDSAFGVYADGAGSTIDLSGFRGELRNPDPGLASIEVRSGASILAPSIMALDRVSLAIRGTGQIPTAQLTAITGADLTLNNTTNDFPALTNLLGTNIQLENNARASLGGITRLARVGNGSLTIAASGPKSVLELPNVTEGAIEPLYQLQLHATEGGKISLPRLASIRGAIDAFADGAGSTVDLPALQGRLTNSQPGPASFEARRGGAVLIPNVNQLDNIDLVLRGTGQIPLAQLTAVTRAELTFDANTNDLPALLNINDSNLTLGNKARLTLPGITQLSRVENSTLTFIARDTGSVLNLPNVVQATVNSFYQLELFAYAGGRIDLPKLANIAAAIDAYAEGNGSVVNLPGIQGRLRNPTSSPASIEVRPGASILMPSVNELEGIDLVIRGTGQFNTGPLRAFIDGEMKLDAATGNFPALANIEASSITLEAGAKLTLDQVTQVVRKSNGFITYSVRGPGSMLQLPNVTQATVPDFYQFELFAYAGGRVTLPQLARMKGGIDLYTEGAESVVDLPALAGVLGSGVLGRSRLEVRPGTSVLIPNVTGLDQFEVIVRGSGTFPSAQFVTLTRSNVTIDDAKIIFAGLADMAGTKFDYVNGGTAVFQPPVDFVVTDIRAPASVVANQPVEIIWEITNLGVALAEGTWSDALFLKSDTSASADALVGFAPASGGFAANEPRSFTNRLIFPARLAGTWRIAVAANQTRTVFEGTNYGNNTNVAPTTIQILAPDLVIESISMQPGSAQLGQTVAITWTVKNTGTAPAAGTWLDRLFLTAGTGAGEESFPLGDEAITETLAPETSYTRTRSMPLPLLSKLPTGPFTVGMRTDARNVVAEANESNNATSTAITLALPPLPDLAIVQVAAPASVQPGEMISLTWTVTNRGNAKATGGWTESVYLAPLNGLADRAPLATFRFTEDLAIAGSINRAQQIALPLQLPAGEAALAVFVDSEEELVESDETNNAAAPTVLPKVPAVLTLQLPLTSIAEAAPDPKLAALVTRNGDSTAPLTTTLTSSDTKELISPATVTFRAGETSVPFALTVQRDGVPDADKTVTITASAAGYQSASNVVTVLNSDTPKLSLQLSASTAIEGDSLTATVSHDALNKPAVTLKLTATGDGQLVLPETVSIPAGQSSVTFTVAAADDTRVEPKRAYTVEASASGFVAAETNVEVLDNELPVFLLSLAAITAPESAGVEATTATVSRGVAGPRSIVVELENSNPGAVLVPASVTIPGGFDSVTFPIGVVNNNQVDGPKTASIRAFALATTSSERVMSTDPVTLTVTDDDGPALTATLGRELVAEGLATATTLTISRNAELTQPLTVSLSSSASGEATVPAAIVIPAGQSSASVPVTTVDDQTPDGSQRAQLTASANGFASGVATLIVTDIRLPDLIVSEVTVPDTAETEAFINVAYRVTNQGLASAGTNWTTRVFLSTDPIVGNDTELADYAFTGNLPVGQTFGQSRQVRLPQAPGDYWVIVTTDIASQIGEILEENNTTISAHQINVVAAYSATVETDIDNAVAGTIVPLRGTAIKTSTGGPAPFALVNIHINLRGTRRIISALADEQGRFATTFTPLPGEAGFYEIGAAHPGATAAPIQDSFTLHGLKAEEIAPIKITENSSVTREIEIQNLGDRPLTKLAATVVNSPANITITASLAPEGEIPGLGTGRLNLTITAKGASNLPGEVLLRITSAEGAKLDIPLGVSVESSRPRLIVNPPELVAGMKIGGQAFVEFEVSNQGGAKTEAINIALPDVPWMHVATPNPLAPLAPGATNHVTLHLRPAAHLPIGAYEGTLAVSAGTANVSVPFSFRALSEAKGDLRVTTVDEYTFYAEGAPKVAGASVTVRDAISSAVVTTGVTDTQGEFLVSQLPEGYYEIQVRAEKHRPFRDTTLVIAGKVNDFQAFPRREAVRYIWTVVPTEIQDRTKITIETIFEAFVPMPVVTVDPPLIDLSDYSADVTQVDLKITNHGLIAAKEAKLRFSEHPDWSLEPLVEELGDIPARGSFTVPVLIKRLSGAAPQGRVSLASARRPRSPGLHGGGGGCVISGSCVFVIECAGMKLGGGASVPVINASASGNCGGGGGGDPGGELAGRGGGGPTGGGATPSSSVSPHSCDECALALMRAILECALKFVLGDTLKCAKDWYGCVSSMKSGPSLGGGYKCVKAVINCAKAAGKKIPLVGALKYIECAHGILTACKGLGGGGGGPGANPQQLNASSLARGALHSTSGGRATDVALAGPDLSQLAGSLRPFTVRLERMQNFFQPMIYVFGDEAWLPDENFTPFDQWTDAFLVAVDEASPEGPRIDAGERASLLARPRPAAVSADLAARTIDRWNRSIDYWNSGIYFLTQVPANQSRDFIALDEWFRLTDLALQAIAESEAQGYTDPVDAVQKFGGEYQKFLSEGDGGGVCAHVRLKLEQEAIVTREAFKASLDIINESGGPLSEVFVDVTVRRRNGQDATAFFAIKPPELTDVTAVDGTGAISPGATGKAVWTLIPTTDAVLDSPEEFLVGGVLRYRQDALNITVPLAPTSITVHPSPSLAVKYFHEREVFADDPFTLQVEPSIPYSLAVMVQNKGHGAARNMRITSAQPKIVENEKGLLADFKIIATEVAGKNLQPSLTVEFGEIGPGTNAIGRWLLTSTILGGFIDYSATFEHLDELGNKKLSLIEGIEIHELIHIVRATGAFDDGRPDFLANDNPDLYDRPDTIHLSDGSVQPVNVVLEGSTDHSPFAANLQVQLTAKLPAGFAYLRMSDPGHGRFRLARVVRSDGAEIPFGDNVWTTDRTFLGNARRPVVENTLHLFDRDSTGQYTLYYALPPAMDEVFPTSTVTALPADSTARIPVTWSGQDNAGGSGIQFYDVFVSIDGGQFISWQHETIDRGAVYQGALGKTYAFYSLATDNAGNREAPPPAADASTTVTRINRAPSLEPISDQSIQEGDTLTIQPVALDPDGDEIVFSLNTNVPPNVVIHPYTGLITWITGEGSGPSVTEFVLQALDNGSPRLGAIQKFKVTIGDVNAPPELEPIANRTINEGRLLSITNRVTDADLPKQKLTFSLGAGAPVGATVDPDTGILTWRPTEFQGGTVNPITVIVRDDGNPPLETKQIFNVTVRDTRADFAVSLGTTNVEPGFSGTLPIALNSGADLSQVRFELESDDPHLARLELQPASDELAAVSFEPVTEHSFRVVLDFDPNRTRTGARSVATLHFETEEMGHSSVAQLNASNLAATRLDGKVSLNALAHNGRVFVVENEPLLDLALTAEHATVVLYGKPGSHYRLQQAGHLDGSSWTDVTPLQLEGAAKVVDLPLSRDSHVFYRVLEE